MYEGSTTGIALDTRQKLFYTRQIFYRQRIICRVLFSDTRVEKHSAKKKTLGKLNINFFLKKQQNIFLNYRNNSPTLPIILTIALSSFTIILNQSHMFCEW
jgi:hypothetical protein